MSYWWVCLWPLLSLSSLCSTTTAQEPCAEVHSLLAKGLATSAEATSPPLLRGGDLKESGCLEDVRFAVRCDVTTLRNVEKAKRFIQASSSSSCPARPQVMAAAAGAPLVLSSAAGRIAATASSIDRESRNNFDVRFQRCKGLVAGSLPYSELL
ncbi:hypothetical protein EJB05_01106, partial [Eragrostis curvula]